MKNKLFVNIDIKIIVPYSAKNKRANFNLPYSVLNPLTNSDSPSDKSNGARFVSIKQVKIQFINKKNENQISLG